MAQSFVQDRFSPRPRLHLDLKPLRLQTYAQALEMRFQLPPVLLLSDAIRASRRGGPLPAIRACEGRPIDQMRQRVEPSFGFALRSFHSLRTSR